jgi:hypothetical protein
MTTIAWDGQTLAADRCSWSGSTRRAIRKIFKVLAPDGRYFLVGFCGEGSFAVAALNWMIGRGEKPDCAKFGVDTANQFAIVIDEELRVWGLSANFTYTQYFEVLMAYGGGQDYAWGALEAGATAKRAIEITIKRSDMAGLGVDTIRFNSGKKK